MVNKNYNRGRAFEYRVKKHLENKGYFVVRSAGSKSPFDLVGIPLYRCDGDTGKVILIQCKYGAKISKKERDRLQLLYHNTPHFVMIVIAWAKSHKPITYYTVNNLEYVWLNMVKVK